MGLFRIFAWRAKVRRVKRSSMDIATPLEKKKVRRVKRSSMHIATALECVLEKAAL